MLQRANDEDKGGNEGVGRWGDRGMADYAKDFHNIRCLKFSHNIRPCAAARQREKAEKGRERSRRRGPKRRAARGGRKSQDEGMRRPGHLGIGLCFLFVLARASRCAYLARVCVRAYELYRTVVSLSA